GEGRFWLEDALTRGPSEPTAARATALNWAGLAAMRDADVGVARNRLEASVVVARHIGNSALLSIALRHLSVAIYDQDAPAGQAVLEEALAIARTSGNAREIAYALSFLGRMHESAGRMAMAEQLYTEGLVPGRSCGDAPPLASLLVNLGRIAAARGDYARAVVLMQEGWIWLPNSCIAATRSAGWPCCIWRTWPARRATSPPRWLAVWKAWSSRGTEVSS
ncbi:MAG TPA: tetratricopeptide repeat protein, partial [Chloroflexota bacterium]|nr:tetratricopeptide repeat protein [Chloroflexota bacterium]